MSNKARKAKHKAAIKEREDAEHRARWRANHTDWCFCVEDNLIDYDLVYNREHCPLCGKQIVIPMAGSDEEGEWN